MDYFTIIKAVGIVAAAIYGAIKSRDLFLNKKNRLREEALFANDFIKMDDGNLHPFVREKGYQAIAGSKWVSADDVSYILTLKDSEQCLNMYVSGKNYLDFSCKKGTEKFQYKEKYHKKHGVVWRSFLYFILYLIFSLLALFPFIFSEPLGIETESVIKSLLITVPIFGIYAWFFLDLNVRINSAKKLVEKQQLHTSFSVTENLTILSS